MIPKLIKDDGAGLEELLMTRDTHNDNGDGEVTSELIVGVTVGRSHRVFEDIRSVDKILLVWCVGITIVLRFFSFVFIILFFALFFFLFLFVFYEIFSNPKMFFEVCADLLIPLRPRVLFTLVV